MILRSNTNHFLNHNRKSELSKKKSHNSCAKYAREGEHKRLNFALDLSCPRYKPETKRTERNFCQSQESRKNVVSAEISPQTLTHTQENEQTRDKKHEVTQNLFSKYYRSLELLYSLLMLIEAAFKLKYP